MSYGITKETQDVANNAPIPTGINENVKMLKPTFKSMKEGNPPVLQYNFQDTEGRNLSHTMWEVNPEQVKTNLQTYPREHKRDLPSMNVSKGDPVTPEQAVQMAYDDFNAYNKHILKRFASEDEINQSQANVNSYETFAKSVIDLYEKTEAQKYLFRLKVVLSYNEKYHQLPKNHYNPFIESAEVPKEKSSLTITQWDKVQPTQVASTDDPTDFSPENFDDEAVF